MTLDPAEIREVQASIADRLYIQVSSWHLYLGDAGLAEALAIECSANLDQGAGVAALGHVVLAIAPHVRNSIVLVVGRYDLLQAGGVV